jgi:hypothetical protein
MCSGASVTSLGITGVSQYGGEIVGSGNWGVAYPANAVRLEYSLDGNQYVSEERPGTAGTWHFSYAGFSCGTSRTLLIKAFPMIIDSAGTRTICAASARSTSTSFVEPCPGTFTRALTAWDQPETGWDGYTLHVADVSGDGRADLVWNGRGTTNRTFVALSNGNGTFSRALTAWEQPETGWSGYSLDVVDVTGEGKADLVWNGRGTTNRTYVALSNGNGTFSRALTAWEQPETGWDGYTLHVADVSGDGRADLVWNSRGTTNRTHVALSNGNGTFTRALTAWDQPETVWDGYTLHVADVSGDGRADLVWNGRGMTNRTFVALSNGNGTFTRALTAWDQPETGWSWSGYTLHVADVSGDGRADLVWNSRGTTNRTYVALSNGNGTFTRALTAWDQPETGWDGYTLHVADVSGDGRADLVWNGRGTTNRTYVALSNGNGTFTRALTAWDQPETGWSWSGYSLDVVDVTGDGKADLMWNSRGMANRTYNAISGFR